MSNQQDNVGFSAGSSGGTAGVIASRGVAGGFCSDTAGSCRIPGAHTGTVGFRPSLGCYNAAGGIVPQTTSRDTVGTQAVCVPVTGHAFQENSTLSDVVQRIILCLMELYLPLLAALYA